MRIVVGLLAILALAYAGIEIFNYDPVANPSAVVTSGNARFTVLTANVIRMEYSNSGDFVDYATLAFVNRNVTVPAFTSSVSAGVLTIQTSSIVLKYTVGQQFSGSTLSVSSLGGSTFTSWVYGQANTGNLLGTIKSLDELGVISLNCTENANVQVHDEVLHCEWGLISQQGWSVVDDSTNYMLDSNYWWVGENTNQVDSYIFTHGSNYRQALADYVQIAGRIAMVPRYSVGTWWTRWFNLNNYDVLKIVDDYKSRSIPLDVFVLDMDWHTKNDWTGYSWDLRLFPYPADTMASLHALGLHMAANIHDADGVGSWETSYSQMAQAVGINPASGQTVPFNLVNSTFAYSLEDLVLKPVLDQGMDFWWIDWQQGGQQAGMTGLKQNPTIWTDHLRSTDHQRRGENVRGLVLARWGGLGNHRYQVGFSGDVAELSWQNLAFQPYFSMTATNVGYGFWSHDIEGPANDLEMYVRWVQWASFSGVFRSHDRGMSSGGCANTNPPSCSIVEVWDIPTVYFEANRAAMQGRLSLVPYIYTAWRQAFDTGLSLIRPMYYDFPTQSNAYLASPDGSFPQYMFGDDILVSPVVTPMDSSTNMTQQSIWIPPGLWYEVTSGSLINGASDGNTILTKSYDLSEIPVFVRAGAIVPSIPIVEGNTIGLAQQQYTSLVFNIHPGATEGSTSVYEDDGYTLDYLTGAFANTTASYSRTSTSLTFTLQASQGGFSSFPASRTITLRILNAMPPTSVSANGASVPYARYGGANSWTYDGIGIATVIEIENVSTSASLTIEVTAAAVNDTLMSGVKGGIFHGILAKANLDVAQATPGDSTVTGGYLDELASTGEALAYLAGTNQTQFQELINGFDLAFANALTEIGGSPYQPLIQFWDAQREDQCLCGSTGCIQANSYYAQEWIEGYQPASGASGVISFNDYWNNVNDNWGTTSTSTPSGYAPAAFGNGYVFQSQVSGTIPLQLWYSSSRNDHMTVASQQGINYAKSNGYTLVTAVLGYVYESIPAGESENQRLAYSIALLQNALI
eukprot:m.200668 g.200668  ORF g.200668 m.200668 type:complete len:1028 (+) comp53818_c0_seq1:262-3345(+)